jgi:putative FmdB family regulatory protein
MPIYEYLCRDCEERFEILLYGREEPVCPACGHKDLEKKSSTFAVGKGTAVPSTPCGLPADGGCPSACDEGSCALN